jgi:mercuric ion transport protein
MKARLNAKGALIGGLLASIGASACCVGPLLLLSLGIGGAWIGHLTRLEPYRPVFIVLVLVFLGMAFRRLYVVPQSCDMEAGCVADRARKIQRILFWVVSPLLLGLVASPWLLPLFYR